MGTTSLPFDPLIAAVAIGPDDCRRQFTVARLALDVVDASTTLGCRIALPLLSG
jgi:hypothetical protein